MNHTEMLTRYVANFVDELVNSGLTQVVISPGSRSTPLAMMVREHEKMKDWIIIDERSAAFFALGMAQKNNKPVALICTSGTAAANYYPAVVEAYYSRVPLVVLTADRPHELRGVGAPQAINQINMYGEYVKWFHEMALPESTSNMLKYVRGRAARAVHTSRTGNAGPVQLNFPFREPLVPDFTLPNLFNETDVDTQKSSYFPTFDGMKILKDTQLQQLENLFLTNKKGLIVCGPQQDEHFSEAVIALARKYGLPVLADPLARVRSGPHEKDVVIEGYDAMLRNEKIRDTLKPDFIIRFGAMPVSKMYLFFVQQHQHIPHFIVDEEKGYRDPTNQSVTFIYADPTGLCTMLTNDSSYSNKKQSEWLDQWQQMNVIVKKHLNNESGRHITEGEAVRGLLKVIPDQSVLYVGNSMAIRDVDTFFTTTSKQINILANRGANGIDGVVSSALGAAALEEKVTLLIGDLSFYHDLNGLLTAKHYNIDLTIVLVNNDGGGIFSFLPQANDEKHFETLFGTPIDIEFRHAVSMYGGNYELVTHENELLEKLQKHYSIPGLSVIEVQTDRTENAAWHRKKWLQIEEELLLNL